MSLPTGRHCTVARTSYGTPLPMLPGTGLKTLRCAGCDVELQAAVFPAFFRGTGRAVPGAGRTLPVAGQVSGRSLRRYR